jgi:hypothetical protein
LNDIKMIQISRRDLLKGTALSGLAAVASNIPGIPAAKAQAQEAKQGTPVWEQARDYSRIVVAFLNAKPKDMPVDNYDFKNGCLDNRLSWMSGKHHSIFSNLFENHEVTYGSSHLPLDMQDFDLPHTGANFSYEKDNASINLTPKGIIRHESTFVGWTSVQMHYAPDSKGKIGKLVKAFALTPKNDFRLLDFYESDVEELNIDSIKDGDRVMGAVISKEIDYDRAARTILHYSGIEKAAELITAGAC